MGADWIVDAGQPPHFVEVKAVHETAVIDDDERIVHRLGRRVGLVNADRMRVRAQKLQYARTIPIHGAGVVNHYLQTVAPAGEQKAAQEVGSAQGVVTS